MHSRRQAIRSLAAFLAASPFLAADEFLLDPKTARLEDLFNVWDFRDLAQKKLDPVAWDYLSEGAKDEVALRDSREAFNRLIIRPKFLTDVHKIDISTKLLGMDLASPIYICPAGGKPCFRQNGEDLTALGAAASKSFMVTNGGIDPLLSSGKGPKNWFYLTTGAHLRDEASMEDFVDKLEDLGCSGICFTVDIMHVSHRERSIHNRFVRSWCETGVPRDAAGKLIYSPGQVAWTTDVYPSRPTPTPTWDSVRKLRELTDLPIILKGILRADDTEMAVKTGMNGVVVSSHGSRQLDHVGAPIEALPECVKAANGKIPVMVDGGFRRGTDVLKALALGASAVGVARPYLWGLTCFGDKGVARVMDLMNVELALDMGMAGIARISDIDRSFVRFRDWGERY